MSVERLKQNKLTGEIRPVVKLVSSTVNPVGTLFVVWHGTRSAEALDAGVVQTLYDEASITKDWYDKYKDDPDFQDDELMNTAKAIIERYPEYAGSEQNDFRNCIESVCKLVLKSNVPASESVYFTWQIDHANVAWREQLVRGKHQQFWTQSTRTMDMRTMDVNMDKSVELIGGQKAVDIYKETVEFIRKAYEELIELGVPAENIRLQPQMHTHRVYWFISLRTLLTILNKRGDWIAQASLWTPIISGVMENLRKLGLYDIISDFVGKPMCVVDYDSDLDIYQVLDYTNVPDCEDRMRGVDPLPIDPLYLLYAHKKMPEHTDLVFYDYMKSLYIQIWDDLTLRALGWDRNDPSKLGPYDRP